MKSLLLLYLLYVHTRKNRLERPRNEQKTTEIVNCGPRVSIQLWVIPKSLRFSALERWVLEI